MISLPTPWMYLLNFGLWPLFHICAALIAMRLPLSFFEAHTGLFRLWGWEQDGRIYERYFRVRRWKHRLPDGGVLLGGRYSQRRLPDTGPAAMRRFALETCRSEFSHWLGLLPAGIFLLWNPWWGSLIMILYGLGLNLPCIIALRYNRARLRRYLERPVLQPQPHQEGDNY